MAASSTHMLYIAALVGGPRSLWARCGALLMFNWTEVVFSSISFFFDVDFPLFDPKASTFRQICPLLMLLFPLLIRKRALSALDPRGTPPKDPVAPQIP